MAGNYKHSHTIHPNVFKHSGQDANPSQGKHTSWACSHTNGNLEIPASITVYLNLGILSKLYPSLMPCAVWDRLHATLWPKWLFKANMVVSYNESSNKNYTIVNYIQLLDTLNTPENYKSGDQFHYCAYNRWPEVYHLTISR